MKKDKKQTIVVAALGVVLLGIGAFQFMPKGSPAPAPVEEKPSAEAQAEAESETDGLTKKEAELAKQEAVMGALGGPLVKRDPFRKGAAVAVATQPTPPPTTAAQNPTTNRSVAPPRTTASTNRRPNPGSMAGQIPPLDPGSLGTIPGEPLPRPGYTVSGVVVGEKPMAVFKDSEGNQRLVPLGGQVDPDTRVVGIERGKVRVKTSEGEKTLTLEGN